MKPLIYALPGNEALGAALVRELGADSGEIAVRRFPDGETYVRFLTSPEGRPVVLACGLDRPDEKSNALYFAASTARELGATSVGLVAPYLAYMRQDARFKPGEAVTSVQFARWLAQFCDWLVTVDPHLHRHPSLGTIYPIASAIVSAAPGISRWIRTHLPDPLVIGPDAESAQWARRVAAGAGCPFLVLSKQRCGDREVEISVPEVGPWQSRTPVLIDDIISTGRTLIAAVTRLREAGMRAPVCIGVHALFVADSLPELVSAGVENIVTCNSVIHPTNAIDVFPDIAAAIRSLAADGWPRRNRGAAGGASTAPVGGALPEPPASSTLSTEDN